MRRSLFVWVFAMAVAGATVAQAQFAVAVRKPERPIPAIERVLVISVDGLRPDRALLANMPTLRAMLHDGAYTFWAKTTVVAITLPSHTSMVTGVTPNKHGISWNHDLPLSQPVYPNQPTLMEMAKKVGYTTAMVAGKSKFDTLGKPGTLDYMFVPEKGTVGNDVVLAEALKVIEQHKPEVLYLHFAEVDSTGHRHGWGSAEQFAAIERT
ncbi:MAG TPA: alkaline phosphatase family protein, partial [Opitutus sp.]|nr:alkaline phosphatase family protein [Opitutus sp.]